MTPSMLCSLQFPTTGFFTFELAPYNTTIGEAGIIVDSSQGVGTSTIVKDPKEEGIYGIPPPGQYQGAHQLCLLHACMRMPWYRCSRPQHAHLHVLVVGATACFPVTAVQLAAQQGPAGAELRIALHMLLGCARSGLVVVRLQALWRKLSAAAVCDA